MELVRPGTAHLASYRDALRAGWTPGGGATTTANQLVHIDCDPQDFLDSLDDPDAQGPPVLLDNGTVVPRLPGFHRWMWDGEFCGSISLRWQPGTADLPPTCLGHIGYSVVPWKRRRGYATAAVAELLPAAVALGLPHVDITTDPDNAGSQRVIEANGGVFIERFAHPSTHDDHDVLTFRIDLHPPTVGTTG